MSFDWFGISAGLSLGLASTLHCSGMCGAIASSLLHAGAPRTISQGVNQAAITHSGRIISYALAGALVGAVGAPAIDWLDREVAYRLAQWAAAVALMWIGLSMAGLLPSLSLFDRILAPISGFVAPRALSTSSRLVTSFFSGLAWGLMPCAMVYGALFTAMLSGSAQGGFTVMAAFGLGTLPGLLVATAGFSGLSAAASRPSLRKTAGLVIGLLGFMTIWAPHLANNVFCAPGASVSQMTSSTTMTR